MSEQAYHSYYISPIGLLRIRANLSFVTEICFTDTEPHWQQNEMENEIIFYCKKELDEYFNGKLRIFKTPLLFNGTEFQKQVWKELMQIPFGAAISYNVLSVKLGNPKAIRAVASANAKNKIAIMAPCHRVIGSDGNLRGYAYGLERKAWLLQHEGAIIV